jgi:hypothetical protein
MAALCAGGLIAIAIVGPVVWDGFWLALGPAAALLIPTAIDLHAACRPRDGRLGTVGSLLLATAAAGLLALAVLGAAITADLGTEPRWLAFPEQVAGYALIAGALLFGAAAFHTRRVPRWAAVAFAVGLRSGDRLGHRRVPLRRAVLLRGARAPRGTRSVCPVAHATRIRDSRNPK